MNDKEPVGGPRLPDDLRALDEELSSIRYEERPSFPPELRAELARQWAERPARRPALRRHLAAAALVALLIAGAGVPSARASLVITLGALIGYRPAEPEAAPVVSETPTPPPPVVEPDPPVEDEVVEIPPAPAVVSVVPDKVESTPPQPPVAPHWLDREQAVALLQGAYPIRLQREGVGGEVWLRVWVESDGTPSLSQVSRRSGVPELDRAALDVAPRLRFEPAQQGGRSIATWIEFPVLFDPDAVAAWAMRDLTEQAMRLPIVRPDDQWEYDEPLDLAALPYWAEESPTEFTDAEVALVAAIGDPPLQRSLGPIESILAGVAPTGRAPTAWRGAAVSVLEDAAERAPDNPAPLLALGRIRLRQGLRTEARMMFERGLQISITGGVTVPPVIVAELHYERGRILRDGWLAGHEVGRVHAYAFDDASCTEARSSGGAASGFASVERLVAWNYLCPGEMAGIFAEGFEPREDAVADVTLTMGSYRAAIDSDPGHVAANVGLLVALADAGKWDDVLAGARRFARHTNGHPHALLLAGLALQQLGRTAEAMAYFQEALARLPAPESDQIRDLTPVIEGAERAGYARLWGDQRRAWEASYWKDRDRTPATPINEREVEHFARSAYALMRFGGVTSDPGEVWVRFGGPNGIHTVDGGAGQLTEFWDYGSGPDITFSRSVASQTMDLTPEGRAYVDDLGKIFPPQ